MNERIEGLVAEGQITEALAELEKYPVEQQGEAWLLYIGELYYKLGKSTEALNRFNAVLRINPENVKALAYVEMINGVLDFFCKDLLNP